MFDFPKKLFIVLFIEFVLALLVLHQGLKTKVLGVSLIAQDVTTDQSTPTDQPVDQPTDQPTEIPTISPKEEPTVSDTSLPEASPIETPSEVVPVESTPESNIFMEVPLESPESEALPLPTSEESVTSEATLEPTTLETPETTEAPLILSDQTEAAASQSAIGAQDEEKSLSLVISPDDRATLLVGFAEDKINDVNHFLARGDFASVNFATQRLDLQLTDALGNLSQVGLQNKNKIVTQVNNLCANIETIFRADSQAVSEDNETDMEIVRGKCLGNNL